MQPRTTAILLVVALALGAFVYFYEVRGAETRRAAEEHAKQLFPEVEAAQVSVVWLRTLDGAKARLERREGDWQIVEPIEFLADSTVVEGAGEQPRGRRERGCDRGAPGSGRLRPG